tara:strand:- start:89 stop:1072 length:984 start_codon:yes stop_codon:yes gene_type:complete
MNILPGGYVSAALMCIERKKSANGIIKKELMESSFWHVNKNTSDLIIKTDMDSDALSGCRLPFPAMAIEWEQDFSGSTCDMKNEKKILYVVDAEHAQQPMYTNFLKNGEGLDFRRSNTEGFYFQVITKIDVVPRWMHWPVAFFVPYKAFENIGAHIDTAKNEVTVFMGGDSYRDGTEEKKHIERVLPYLYGCDIKQEEIDVLTNELGKDFQLFTKFIAALSCSAVETEEVDPNKTLSRLRRSRLKYSLNKYRTIIIDAPSRRSSSENDGDGADISPHWRRGHIRRQPTKEGIKNVWIRPTIVCRNKVVEPLPLPKSKVISQSEIRAF